MQPVLGADYGPEFDRENPTAGLDIHNISGDRDPQAAPRSMRPPGQAMLVESGEISQSIFEAGRYGDAQLLSFTFAALGTALVLQRPLKSQRTLLVIVNDLAAGTMRVGFDNPPAAAVGIPIVAGGNLFFDTKVPQNDIWVFSPGGGVVTILYINADITNPTRVLRASAG